MKQQIEIDEKLIKDLTDLSKELSMYLGYDINTYDLVIEYLIDLAYQDLDRVKSNHEAYLKLKDNIGEL
jgi:hypothetical protein